MGYIIEPEGIVLAARASAANSRRRPRSECVHRSVSSITPTSQHRSAEKVAQKEDHRSHGENY